MTVKASCGILGTDAKRENEEHAERIWSSRSNFGQTGATAAAGVANQRWLLGCRDLLAPTVWGCWHCPCWHAYPGAHSHFDLHSDSDLHGYPHAVLDADGDRDTYPYKHQYSHRYANGYLNPHPYTHLHPNLDTHADTSPADA